MEKEFEPRDAVWFLQKQRTEVERNLDDQIQDLEAAEKRAQFCRRQIDKFVSEIGLIDDAITALQSSEDL